jgi:hypothetical protein
VRRAPTAQDSYPTKSWGKDALLQPESRGGERFQSHLCRFSAVVDERKQADLFGLQNILELILSTVSSTE